MSVKKRLLVVGIYAGAMAWVESAVVFYLRTMIHRMIPYQTDPLPNFGGLGTAEIIREIATLIMLLSVGMLAGQTRRSRFAIALFAFGVWDIFYYLFLIPLTGWPRSLFDWDILFLFPLPWWGPVIAPIGVSALMILSGCWIAFFDSKEEPLWPSRLSQRFGWMGIGLALYAFLSNSLRSTPAGVEAIRQTLPTEFPWLLFCIAFAGMCIPLFDILRQTRMRYDRRLPTDPRFPVPSSLASIHPGKTKYS
jgi:hypothetical protein